MLNNTEPNYWIGRKATKKLAKASGQSKKQVRKDLAFLAGTELGQSDKDVVAKFHNEVLEPFISAALKSE